MSQEQLMSLQKGAKLKNKDTNEIHTLESYDEKTIPVNDYSATMSWYPSKPIWTPEEYEEIRFKFMMVVTDKGSFYLKNFTLA
jgi:hypothetical protein